MKKIIGTLLILGMLLTMFPAAIMADSIMFSDVKETDYYASAIQHLYDRAIIGGYDDATFRPMSPITKAEFATIVCKAFNLIYSSDAENPFKDVNNNHWAINYIKQATANGIINGDGSGNFYPDNKVKYEEAIKMLVCAVGLDKNIEKDPVDWSAGYIKAAEEAGMTNNSKGIKGQYATRGDIAVLFYNALTKQQQSFALIDLWEDSELPPPDFSDFSYGSINNPLSSDEKYSKKEGFYSLPYKVSLTDSEKQLRIYPEKFLCGEEALDVAKNYIGKDEAKCAENQEWLVFNIKIEYIQGEGLLDLTELFSADNLYNSFGEKYNPSKFYLFTALSQDPLTNHFMMEKSPLFGLNTYFGNNITVLALVETNEGYRTPILKIKNAHSRIDEGDMHGAFFTETALYVRLYPLSKTIKQRTPPYYVTIYGPNTYLVALKLFQLEIKKDYYQDSIKTVASNKIQVLENGKYVESYSEETKQTINKLQEKLTPINQKITELKNYPFQD